MSGGEVNSVYVSPPKDGGERDSCRAEPECADEERNAGAREKHRVADRVGRGDETLERNAAQVQDASSAAANVERMPEVAREPPECPTSTTGSEYRRAWHHERAHHLQEPLHDSWTILKSLSYPQPNISIIIIVVPSLKLQNRNLAINKGQINLLSKKEQFARKVTDLHSSPQRYAKLFSCIIKTKYF